MEPRPPVPPLRIAILCQADSWYARDLIRAAGPEDTLVPVGYRELSVARGPGLRLTVRPAEGPPLELADFDALLIRSMPLGSLEQVIFRVNTLHAAASAGLAVVNSPRSLEIAIDKWLTLEVAAASGVAVPRTAVCQNRQQALQAFESLGGDVVVKPLFGGEGRGLMRVSCADLAWRVFSTLEVNQSVIYLQEFVPHGGADVRVLVIGRQAYAIRRVNEGDWRTNLARGGRAVPYQASAQELEMAFAAAEAVGAEVAGVDLLAGADGRPLLLEVNAVPGWKGLAEALRVDIAAQVLEHVRGRVSL